MNPLFVPCPTCDAEPNQYCRDQVTGSPKMTFHTARER